MKPIKNVDKITCIVHFNTYPENILFKEVKHGLESDIAIVTGFPDDNDAIIHFLQRFGSIMERRRNNFLNTTNLIGNVTFRSDIKKEERLPTQTADEICFHTARAFEKIRPDLFCMYMTNPGWTDEITYCNGESKLIKLSDILEELGCRFPHQYKDIIEVLLSTEVKYKPWYLDDEPLMGPLLYADANGNFSFRYWEDFASTLNNASLQDEQLSAILKLGFVIEHNDRKIEFQLEKGDLLIVNNNTVAHARYPFKPSKINWQKSRLDTSERKIKSLHVKYQSE